MVNNMFGYIYLTTNKINNKKYIGQHKYSKLGIDPNYIGSGILLKEAIDKYGKENFKTEILEWCDSRDKLNEREIYYISKYMADTDESYYNIAKGGDGHSCEPWNKGKTGVQEVTESMLNSLEYGRHLPASDKLKEKLHNRKDLVDYTDEYRNKLKIAQSHNRTVNDGTNNIIVKDYELDEWLNKPGIFRGRVKK